MTRNLFAALPFLLIPALSMAQDATATFIDTEGNQVGEANLSATTSGVLIALEVRDLPPEQWVAFHIHETGECDHETGHDSAGGHFNPAGVEHGYMTETGPHAGDMPNQWVGSDGTLRAEVFNPQVGFEGDASVQGRALMIHAGADDHSTQPTGDAGARLACAVIE